MTRADYTAIKLLIDRSGSMAAIKRAAEDGINEFINSQHGEPGHRTISIAVFDADDTHRMRYDRVCPSTPAVEVPRFELAPRGLTPLLDAMAKAITEFGNELAGMPEDQRPATVIFAVMTDGLENASHAYDWHTIKEMVERQQRDYSWHVVYLGANQDAIAVAADMGIPQDSAMTYAATDHGTRSATHSMGAYVTSAACGQSAAFTDEQRKDATQ